MDFAIVILLFVIGFILFTGLILVVYQRVIGAALTEPFRAAETIVNGGVPTGWLAQINRQLAWRRLFLPKRGGPDAVALLIKKIDRLHRYFENNSFYESIEARQVMLSRLRAARLRWCGLTWTELQALKGSQGSQEEWIPQPDTADGESNVPGGT
jgi:hypothetical protein